MTATVDYFANDEDNQTDWTDWWTAMASNDAIITSGWTEAYVTHYTGGYGEYIEGHVGDAHMVVSYCHSPGVESWYNDNWTKSAALDLPRAAFHQIEYASAVEGGNLGAASEFIEYLLSEDVNVNMPTENFMYSVLEGTDLPEDKGYRFHSTVPAQAAEISASEIAEKTWNHGSKIGTKQWLLLDMKTKPVAYLAVTIYTLLVVVPLWLAVDRLIWVAGFDVTNWISSSIPTSYPREC